MADSNNNLAKILMGAVALLIAIVLISTVSTEGNKVTTLTYGSERVNFAPSLDDADTGIINPAKIYYPAFINATNSSALWKRSNSQCDLSAIVASITASNTTGAAMSSVDYAVNAIGGVTMKAGLVANATSKYNNITVLTYRYCGDDYIEAGWVRTTLGTTYGLFALAALGVALALFYSVMKDVM
jgi:hypothetical protein